VKRVVQKIADSLKGRGYSPWFELLKVVLIPVITVAGFYLTSFVKLEARVAALEDFAAKRYGHEERLVRLETSNPITHDMLNKAMCDMAQQIERLDKNMTMLLVSHGLRPYRD
jgi:hypothetical protein